MKFNSLLLKYIEEKLSNKGRYNILGVPLEFIKEICLGLDKKEISYKGGKLQVSYLSEFNGREIPIFHKELTESKDENELAMNVRNSQEIGSDYLFASEKEVNLASGENTITTFPLNWNNKNNDFLKYLMSSTSSDSNRLLDVIISEHYAQNKTDSFWEKIPAFVNEIKNEEAVEKNLGFAKGQTSKIEEQKYVIVDLFEYLHATSKKDSLEKCKIEIQAAINNLTIDTATKANLVDAFESFFNYIFSIISLNPISISELRNTPHYFYSPKSLIRVDSNIKDKWDQHWAYITFEKLEEILDFVNAKRTISTSSSGSKWNITLNNRIASKIIHPSPNRTFNYTIGSGDFQSSTEKIHQVKVNSRTTNITPPSYTYSHVETGKILKSTNLKFISGSNSASPIWRFIQLDQFEPGIGIGFSNVKIYSNNSYPKKIVDNIWKAEFKLNSKNSDSLEIISNLNTTVTDVFSVNIDFDQDLFEGLAENEILKNFICPESSQIETRRLEIKSTEENQTYKRTVYDAPLKYDHQNLEYYVVIKTTNKSTNDTFCVIAELEFEEENTATKNSYFEKYLYECFNQGKEFNVDFKTEFSTLKRVEDFAFKNNEFQKPYIIALNEELTLDWFHHAEENRGNISRNIFSDYSIKDNLDDFRPSITVPKSLLDKRKEFLKLVTKERIDLTQIDFTEKETITRVEEYANEYNKWLDSEPDVAVWYDLLILCEEDRENNLVKSNPWALIVPSFHPFKLIQQMNSQLLMKNSRDSRLGGCPGAGLIDTTSSPSNLTLKYGASLQNIFSFYSINSDNQYVTLLINKDYYGDVFNSKYRHLMINPEMFDIGLFDSSNAISSEQVKNAIDDVSNIYAAKSTLSICAEDYGEKVSSGFTRGIFNWFEEVNNLNSSEKSRLISQNKVLKIFDNRTNTEEQPDAIELRSISTLADEKLKWYNSKSNEENDLMVICNLPKGQYQIQNCDSDLELYNPFYNNYRLPNIESYNSRVTEKMSIGIKSNKTNKDLINSILYKLENQSVHIEKIESQSNLNQLEENLGRNKFTVVSGIDLDPSSFESMSDSILYDYNTVNYTPLFGPVNKYGYFLIANDKKFIRASIGQAIDYNFNTKLDGTQLDQFIDRICTNGVSDLKAIYSGGNKTKGELGVYIANHILNNLKTQTNELLNFVSPIDPFLPKIDGIMKYLKKGGDVKERPDLLFFSICKRTFSIKISSIEVKFRDKIDNKDMKAAMSQAQSFNSFIRDLISERDELWKLTALDFVLMLMNYGFNHLISRESDRDEAKELLKFRATLINEIFTKIQSKNLNDLIEVSKEGRVIVTSPNATKSEFVQLDKKFHRINIDEEYAFKCINNETIEDLKDEWFRVSPNSRSFFDLDVECSDEISDSKKIKEEEKIESINSESDYSENTGRENDQIIPQEDEIFEVEVQSLRTTLNEEIKYNVGKALSKLDKSEFYFTPNNTELNQLNIGIVGDLGTGKTQLLKNFIYKIGQCHNENRGIAPKFLIFDTKKDYDLSNGGELDKVLHKKVQIKTLKPSLLPLNIFDLRKVTGTNRAYTRAKFISNIFKKIYNIGIVQENKLTTIILECYMDKGYTPSMSEDQVSVLKYPTFNEIYEKYDKEDSVKAILFDIVQSYIFETDETKHLRFEDLFQNSLVLSLGDLVENQRELVMIIVLILYREYMIGIKKQPFIESNGKSLRKVDSFVLIDEANQIMDYEFDVLEDILLKGREFGVGVILSTQYLSHFKKSGINYAESLNTWFIHKQNRITKREILNIGLQNADDERIKQIKGLKVFECLYKSLGNDDGVLLRGNPFFENFEEN